MYKIDLHTHSVLSYDGGISANDYFKAIQNKKLDLVAVTDHNQIDFALKLQEKLGDRIIVGEEIMCSGDVEIIGLYLGTKIQPNQSVEKTISAIKQQAGLVYVPHALDLWRHGIGKDRLVEILRSVDIIEVYNSRSYNNKELVKFCKQIAANYQKIAFASSTDAHGHSALGQSFSSISQKPNAQTLVRLLQQAQFQKKHAGIFEILAPSFNKIRKRLK